VHTHIIASCCHPEHPLPSPTAQMRTAQRQPTTEEHKTDEDDEDQRDATADVEMRDANDDEDDDADARTAARQDGEVFPATTVTRDTFPARQPRLRLRRLTDEEYDAAAIAVEQMARSWACKIDDAPDWTTGEGYIEAIPSQLRAVLAPYSVRAATSRPQRPTAHTRPPRTTCHQREHRLDEAIDALTSTQRQDPTNQKRIYKARRRVARVRGSMETSKLRKMFNARERDCVQSIFASARPATQSQQTGTCPITTNTLQEHFQEQCQPTHDFDYAAHAGSPFRSALKPPSGHPNSEGLQSAPTLDEIEDQLKNVKANTSPGHDGIGYDVWKRFATQVSPLLTTMFGFCWRHRRVPSVWKVGNVRLIHKKGDMNAVSNWRPICLQPTIYKLYTGLLAQRLSSWLEGNALLPMSQKGFRQFNGCNENNFMTAMMLDQARRLHRRLSCVSYTVALSSSITIPL
jgi:hypothetical protein